MKDKISPYCKTLHLNKPSSGTPLNRRIFGYDRAEVKQGLSDNLRKHEDKKEYEE